MKLLIFLVLFFSVFAVLFLQVFFSVQKQMPKTSWNFQSIDTMKYSRDLSREKLTDPSFNQVIQKQMIQIKSTGATHVAIATPYDEEFYPILKRWVDAARANNLKVWFRGNFSGWEGWFGYSKISREEHMKKTIAFIENHKELFQDGDVFTACPECENGGPGDPRATGDISGHRRFLTDEYIATSREFEKIGKNVLSNYDSMNADVARAVMDTATTKKLGGIVVVDHYVNSPEKLQKDIIDIAHRSQGKVILGEFGAPIPDINGQMSEQEQYEWLQSALGLLKNTKELAGLNYWVSYGGSTELWNGNGTPREAVQAITHFYKNER